MFCIAAALLLLFSANVGITVKVLREIYLLSAQMLNKDIFLSAFNFFFKYYDIENEQ